MRQEFRCPTCGSTEFGSTLHPADMKEIVGYQCHGHGCGYTASSSRAHEYFITVAETLEEANLLARLTGVICNAAGPFVAQLPEVPSCKDAGS